MNSTAAMTGMGMKDAYGIKSTSTRSSTIECTMPATGLLPPLLMLAAVLAMAPVAGMPPNSAEPMLPMPWAMSSVSGRCLSPVMPSATTQDSSDSMAARMAMVTALGNMARIIPKEMEWMCRVGSLLLTV